MNYLGKMKLISALVIIVSLLVIVGWIFDITLLKSVSPNWQSMTVSTALGFFIAGAAIYLLARNEEGHSEIAEVFLPIMVILSTLMLAQYVFAALSGVPARFEELVNPVAGDLAILESPALTTLFAFGLMLIGIIMIIIEPKMNKYLHWIGYVIGAIGIVALAGYAIGAPLLYGYVPGSTTAMSVHTAILFVLLGAALVLFERKI
jgi:Co/Zn/Cd efflux system component